MIIYSVGSTTPNRRSRWCRFGLLAVASALLTTGCGASGSPKDGGSTSRAPGVIGIAMPKTTGRWPNDGNNLQLQLRLRGYGTDLKFTDNDVKTQVQQVQAMVDRGDQAIVVAPVDGDSMTGVLANAAKKSIPVIAYDRIVSNTPNVAYYATFDSYRVGVLQATYLVDHLGLKSGKGPFNIELFGGSPTDNNSHFVYNGAMSVLGKYLNSGKLVVRSGQTALTRITTLNWDGDIGAARLATLVDGYYKTDRLDAVLAPSDGVAEGLVAKLQKLGYGESGKLMPLVTGQDAALDSMRSILAGGQSETVFKDTRLLAKIAAGMVDDVINRRKPKVNDTKTFFNGVKTIPTYLLIPVPVDKTNYQDVLVNGGYYTESQLTS